MFIIKAYAEATGGGRRGPTSVQGQVYDRFGTAFVGTPSRDLSRPGRPVGANFVPPRRMGR